MWGEICASANPRSCGARPWFLSGGVVRGPWGFTAGDSLIPFLAFPFSGHLMNSARRSARSPLRSPVLGFSRSSEGPSCRGSSWLASGRTDHPTALSRFIVPASDSFPGGRRRSRDELPHMTIISDFHAPVGDDGALLSEKHIGRHERSQRRAPKKVHKAEREKLKREHLNDLFLELGHALEPGRHNSGKASVLGDATRLLREMISQVESLRRENASLATESRFVAMEKNELRDENLALEQEIQRLQEELKEKGRSKPAWRGGAEVAPPQPSTAAAAAVVGPVYVFPINQELAAYSTEPAAAGSPPKPPSQVARPHARYPTPADSWPGQILTLQLRPPETQDDQHGGGGDGAGSDGAGTSTSSSSGGGRRTEGC